jgi:uncharacterized membrane protein YdbT with pleckstrin-like domain
MRPENEWFTPEKLTAYYYLYEVLGVLVVIGTGAGLASLGVLSDAPRWVVGMVVVPPIVAFAFLTWWIPAFYRTVAYRLTDDELEYRRGVFFRQRSTVPYDRITNVNASQGPIQRLVGAGSVAVHTAGYGGQMGAELSIGGVGDFEAIKEQVLDKVRRRRPVATESGDTTDTTVAADDPATPSEEMLAELRRIRELLERDETT